MFESELWRVYKRILAGQRCFTRLIAGMFQPTTEFGALRDQRTASHLNQYTSKAIGLRFYQARKLAS